MPSRARAGPISVVASARPGARFAHDSAAAPAIFVRSWRPGVVPSSVRGPRVQGGVKGAAQGRV
eukprot:10504155-Lingulodinium_polyedra.AAC.1